MSGVEHAREMITLAQRDFKALQGMLDVETFADEIFDAFYDLVDLTDFAVQFRYRIFEAAEGRLNRGAMVRQVNDFVHVERRVRESETAG